MGGRVEGQLTCSHVTTDGTWSHWDALPEDEGTRLG
jgi:hypothetical protein